MPSQDHARPKYYDGVQLGSDDVIFGIQILGSDASTSPTTPRAISTRVTGAARPIDVAILDASGVQIVPLASGGTVDTELPAAAVLADATVNPTVPGVGSFNEVYNGSTWDRMRGSTTGVQAVGGIAHNTANTSANNPQVQGHEAIAHGTNPTAVAATAVTKLYANRAGVPFVIGGHPNIVTLEAAYTTAQTDTAIITVASGLKIVVTRISAMCDNANTVNVGLRVGFGATTTPTTTGVVLTHPGIAAGSGVIEGNGSGILGVGADGEDLRVTSGVPTTGSLRILVSYYTIES